MSLERIKGDEKSREADRKIVYGLIARYGVELIEAAINSLPPKDQSASSQSPIPPRGNNTAEDRANNVGNGDGTKAESNSGVEDAVRLE